MGFTANELLKLGEQKEKWTHLGRWVQPTLSMCFWPLWGKRQAYKELGLPEVKGYNLQLDGHFIGLKEDHETLHRSAFEACEKKNDSLFQNYSKGAAKTCENLLMVAKNLENEEVSLEKRLSEFFDSLNELISPWVATLLLDLGVTSYLSEELDREKLTRLQLVSHFEPTSPTLMMKQEREAKEFAEYLRDAGLMHVLEEKPEKAIDVLNENHEKLAKRLTAHLKEFEWVGTHHCWGDPLTAERLFTQVKEMPEGKKEEKWKNVPEKIAWVIKQQNELAYWRQYCAECSDIGFYKARPLLKKAGEKLGLTYEEIIWLSDKEILNGLRGEKIVSKEELRKRQKAFGYTEGDGDEVILVGKQLQKLVELHLPKVDTAVKEFVGTVGNKGLVIGRAFVAATPQEAAPLKKGEILVVPQTTPDYIVIMKRAAAIVTDEGGMTCHAAIVSRELGVPCVVGTKIATRVLKTGDKVEVDANSGIVRKLSSANRRENPK